MKIATIRTEDGTRAAVLDGGKLVPLEFEDVGSWLQAGSPDWSDHVAGTPLSTEEADFAPVVPRPGKIICVGLNYRDHILEMGRELPEYPTLFAKFSDSLIGAHDDIVLPPGSSSIDWEGELAVFIGTSVSRADEAQARNAVAGFAVANDVSARDFQRRTPEWLQGKTFDRTTPLGPYLVTVDETGTEPDLDISCAVDGITKQHSRTSELVFGPLALIQYISAITTLRPGDVILTGTPGGVGDGRNPKEFLDRGSVLETSINTLGATANRCIVE
ncbi:acylpyruvate hydrolase [Paenarthrobacter nicotinovorans]|uniref:fumarylacetoacetate hydrolase family protein n=1 Tax=Micrococcaceae TaxID=1268 RepID=UPI00087717CD|nr:MULTISPECIES: fumarylacetoacetate hydrolase family protein [Micrococcaceae]MDR6438706.1 acylpyruvate hydrolase [Paenarthrobacter nicotinovorans]SCZ56507.1 acylpyruvate hydrolase [Arthrobacter sp. UNCCL28]